MLKISKLIAQCAVAALVVVTPISASLGDDVKPKRFAEATIGGHVVGKLAKVDGGCILTLRTKSDSDDYAPYLSVWFPASVAIPHLGYWCKEAELGDYLRVKATLHGWNCGWELCGAPWVHEIVAHRKLGEK